MTAAQITFGPIRDTDVEIDADLAAKLRPRIRPMSPEEYDRYRRKVIFSTRSTDR